MKKILSIILVALLFPALSRAAMTFTSVTGSATQDSILTVVASGITGTFSDAVLLNFDASGHSDGDSMSINTDIDGSGFFRNINSEIAPVYSTDRSISGKSMKCNYPSDTGTNCFITKSFGDSGAGTVFLSFWLYFDPSYWDGSFDHYQWKMVRFLDTMTFSGNNTGALFNIDMWPDSRTAAEGANDGTDYCYQAYHNNEYFLSGNASDHTECSNVTDPMCFPSGVEGYGGMTKWRSCFAQKQWLQFEVVVKESDINTTNGTHIVRWRVEGSSTWQYWQHHTASDASNYLNNLSTRGNGTGDDGYNYYRNLTIGGHIGATTGKIFTAYYDNIFVQRGMHGHFMFCEGNTFANRGKCTYLKPTGWSSTGATLTVDVSAFATNDTVYLYYAEEDGSDTGVKYENSFTVAGSVTTHVLTINKSGVGSGTVTSSPAGIDCGGTCSASFDSGTPVTLTATPDSGYGVTWSGNCDSTGHVTMSADKSCTATFSPLPVQYLPWVVPQQ